jgi:RecQ family ATP-dependent DNA helicase
MLWTDKAKKILLKYWNFDTLKDKQVAVINQILSGNDVIGLLPTGYGKSICYILPPLITKKTIFIISPLISLMDDQKDKLLKMGIPVSALHCNNINKENDIRDIIDGKIKIVYMSPEYIIDGDGLDLANSLIENNQLGYLAIDESHCLSSWGHDFRPQYLKLRKFRDMFPFIPIMAVTATANEIVVNEIIKFLQLKSPDIIRANFDRPNLYIECNGIPKEIIKKKEKQVPYEQVIKNYINKYPDDRIIIYVNSRKKTDECSNMLNELGYKSSAYHAGLNKKSREKVQIDFIENKCKVIIATIAFGMGIDQIVKCVLVFGCPSSIEEYYQQIGRGGRDGLYCETALYFDKSSVIKARFMINKETKNQLLKSAKYDNLAKVEEYFYTKKCRRQYILDYLGLSKSYFAYNGFTCANCDNCTQYKLTDITDHIWDYYINNNKLNKKIENITFEFKLKKILPDWKAYVEFKKYTLKTLPDNMHIKLRLENDILDLEDNNLKLKDDKISNYDIIYDKFDNIQI